MRPPFEAIDAADRFNLGCVDNMSLFLAEMANPIQPIRMVADPVGRRAALCAHVTPRQWHDFYTSSSGRIGEAMLLPPWNAARAGTTPSSGEGAMWRGISGQAYKGMPIRFNPGQHRQGVCGQLHTTGAEVDKVAGTLIDRAVLLGGQALANAFGSGEQGGSGMHEKKEDHDNSTEISIN